MSDRPRATTRLRVIHRGKTLYRERRRRRDADLLIVAMVEVMLSTFRTVVRTAASRSRGRRASAGFLSGER